MVTFASLFGKSSKTVVIKLMQYTNSFQMKKFSWNPWVNMFCCISIIRMNRKLQALINILIYSFNFKTSIQIQTKFKSIITDTFKIKRLIKRHIMCCLSETKSIMVTLSVGS